MSGRELPGGWTIELDPGARRTDGGTVLVGGNPLRVLRLSEAGARWLDGVARGDALSSAASSRRLAQRLVDAGLARPVPPGARGEVGADLAVVIPVRDDPAGLSRTLASLRAVATAATVVVDDASPVAVVLDDAEGVTVVRNDRRLGPAGARERGWRATDAPLIAFVDADIAVDEDGVQGSGTRQPGWLEPLLAHFDDPDVGAVAPRVACSQGTAPAWLAAYEEVRSPLDMGPRGASVRPGGTVGYVPTALLVARRSALESVGGFDTTMEVGEDVDLVWRLLAAGWRVHYEPAVVVHHPIRPALGAWARQRFRYGTSAATLAARHGGMVAPLRISGWSALAWAAVLAGRPVLGVGVGAGTTLALVPKLRALRHPPAEAMRIAGVGNLRAGEAAADALWRVWWPVALASALLWRRSRPALAAAAVVPPVVEWRRRRPGLGALGYGLLRRADDAAYGAGVWAGCIRARSMRALLPSPTGPVAPPERVGPPAGAGRDYE
ncbi:MAG TPA: mycofactocin biosynthesis glycosyltransferase MftF [Acidimicrobiales bacterium]|nr:mycofactocin biosynthesis glycosyltransferase MftF [Acidimicrobiales bacterium]